MHQSMHPLPPVLSLSILRDSTPLWTNFLIVSGSPPPLLATSEPISITLAALGLLSLGFATFLGGIQMFLLDKSSMVETKNCKYKLIFKVFQLVLTKLTCNEAFRRTQASLARSININIDMLHSNQQLLETRNLCAIFITSRACSWLKSRHICMFLY